VKQGLELELKTIMFDPGAWFIFLKPLPTKKFLNRKHFSKIF
jgi:hypothetical protein